MTLVCDVCGKEPWWSLPRVGDPCPDDDGHLVEREDHDMEQMIGRGDLP